jgi:hypothetical protein
LSDPINGKVAGDLDEVSNIGRADRNISGDDSHVTQFASQLHFASPV